jgi:hypothetical protein
MIELIESLQDYIDEQLEFMEYELNSKFYVEATN